MKKLTFIILLIMTLPAFAEELTLLARINEQNQVIRSETGDQIPVITSDEFIRKKMQELPPGSEVILKGQITYLKSNDLHDLRPWFVVESVRGISLQDLRPDPYLPKEIQVSNSTPRELVLKPSFAVTTEVVSAMTFTSSILLLQEFSSQSNVESAGKRQMQQALFISAGTMATLFFLYEQFQGKSKP